MARNHHDDKRMELTEHLGELRTHIIRSIMYLIVGAVVAYQFFTPLYGFISRPLNKEIDRLNHIRAIEARNKEFQENKSAVDIDKLPPPHNPPTMEDIVLLQNAVKYIYNHPNLSNPLNPSVFPNVWEPFMVRLKLSIVFGFILVMPLVVRELVLFILPALTPEERKPFRFLIPLSILLLLFGMTIAYLTLFFAIQWFLSYLTDFPAGATLLQNPDDYIMFFAKMMAAFGLAFQLPVVLMTGAYVNLITSKGLITHWRWGVVLAVLGGVLTPSNDLPSMLLMAIPLLLLYFGSIFLVKIVERNKIRSKPDSA